MPLIIFWLTPIVVAVVVLLFILTQRTKNKPKLFLVEPLLFLAKSYQIARLQGNEKVLRRLLELWLPGLEMHYRTVGSPN